MHESSPQMSIEQSRRELLECIGPAPELTLVRGFGNIGDDLIWAGQRELLGGHIYREISIPELSNATGDTVLLSGGGAWSMSYHEHMPTVLAIAESRFERVIVLPSTFDVRVDRVREALANSRATIFARESESYLRIQGLCDARLAHDGAFFFDYAPFQESAHRSRIGGTLQAFRTDRESMGQVEVPEDNDDISATAANLDDWLAKIAKYEKIKTDRAHVMIAAAMMGRKVEFSSGGYFKLEALARTLPSNSRVSRCVVDLREGGPRIAPGSSLLDSVATSDDFREAASADSESIPTQALRPAPKIASLDGRPRVCAVILSHNRHAMVARSAASVHASGNGVRTLIYDNNSDDRTRAELTELATGNQAMTIQLADRNVGCAGGRSLAVERVPEEFVLFLDDDAELLPGSLELLVAELDAHPRTQAVTASVISPDGSIQHCGGSYFVDSDYATFTGDGSGLDFFDASAPTTGRCDWVPGTAALIRRSAFDVCPIDPMMSAYYEDNDWALRMQQAFAEPFRRCREAIAIHRYGPRASTDSLPALADHYGRRIQTMAHFYSVHDRILRSGGAELAEVLSGTGELANDPAATRLLLRAVGAAGSEQFAVDWAAGDFAAVLATIRYEVSMRAEAEVERDRLAAQIEVLRAQRRLAVAKRDKARSARRKSDAAIRRIESSTWWRMHPGLSPAAAKAKSLQKAIQRRVTNR